jgi:hypothetical protein
MKSQMKKLQMKSDLISTSFRLALTINEPPPVDRQNNNDLMKFYNLAPC